MSMELHSYSALWLILHGRQLAVFCCCVREDCKIRVKLHFSYATIIAVYAPTNPNSSTSEAVAPSIKFYNQSQSTTASVPRKDMIIVLVDFNACIGHSSPHWKSIVGPFTPDEVNDSSSLLLNFCATNHLFIFNT